MNPTGRLRGAVAPPTDADQPGAAGLAGLLGARVHVDVVIPRTQIAGKMRLLGRLETSTARADARRELAERGISTDPRDLMSPVIMDEWNNEVAVRTLAIAVRDPRDTELPLDTIEEWLQCDDDQIAALYIDYKDLATRLDPLGTDTQLTDQEMSAIDSAAKKKAVELLMDFGSRKLALFMTTSVVPPAS